jgi:choline monooxygenase
MFWEPSMIVDLQISNPARKFDPADPSRSHTLPSDLYYREDIFEREKEAIFYKSWIFICSAGQVAAPGDYTTAKIGDQNIAIVRGKDGELRGFHNVCSHRAHELLSGAGRTSTRT